MNVLDNFKHEETFKLMDMSDKIVATGYVIILGIGITFVALVLIWIITVLMSKIIQGLEKKSELIPLTSNTPVVVKSVSQAYDQLNTDDEELVAVITAAIAASMNTSMHHIRVTNIKRVVDQTPTWGKMGRNDVMNARMN